MNRNERFHELSLTAHELHLTVHCGINRKRLMDLKRGYWMKENILVDLSKQFAIDIITLCTPLQQTTKGNILLNQLLRSGTSIGANIHEANYAVSRADFINKFQIALKECYESDYWLELFKETKMISNDIYAKMHQSCSKIRTLLISSLNTAKQNVNK